MGGAEGCAAPQAPLKPAVHQVQHRGTQLLTCSAGGG